mgnify:CR=1 FL=1
MTEENSFTIMDKLAEIITLHCSFENKEQVMKFMKVLEEELLIYLDKDYSSEDSISSEEIDSKNIVEEEINVIKDKDGFYKIK